MAFEFNPEYKTRIYYEPGGSAVYRFPSGNIYSAMAMLLKLEANIVSNTASNAPDFQIFNAIASVTLIRNSNQIVWSLSGQALALMFTYDRRNGSQAVGNAAIAGSVANNVQGQHYLHCPFHPLNAMRPWDFAVDTRGNDYELRITWRDLTVAGTLFGTISGTVTVTNSENYLEIELQKLDLRPNPINGAPDSLTNVVPMIVGIREERQEVNSSNTQFQIDIPDFQNYRNVLLFTTHIANTLQEVGENDIIQNRIKVFDTQNRVKQERLADMVRQETSRRWGLGSSIPNGFYDVDLLAFGAASDVIVASNITDLQLQLDVVKQSNATYVRTIYITQEKQV